MASAPKMHIALLEDEAALAEQLIQTLRGAGHQCEHFASGKALIAGLKRATYDLLVLDWNLPDMTGIEVLGWARAHVEGPLPVLFVTSRSAEADIVAALDQGADDYVVKPIQPAETVARINALFRRSYPQARREIEEFGLHAFNRPNCTVATGGDSILLTPKEFELALLLFRNQDRALARAYMMDAVWGHDPDVVSRTLDVHISRIREKLRLRPAFGYRLVPVYTYGYRLERVTPESIA
jgi:DNA-binding response OmpR family regulator